MIKISVNYRREGENTRHSIQLSYISIANDAEKIDVTIFQASHGLDQNHKRNGEK